MCLTARAAELRFLHRRFPRAIRPVSYTHLDVYKRQLQVLGNGGYEEKKVTVKLDKNTNKAADASETKESAQPSEEQGEQSILEEFGNGSEDDATYEEFFGDIW